MKFIKKIKNENSTTYIIGNICYIKIANRNKTGDLIPGLILNKHQNMHQHETEKGVAVHDVWMSLFFSLVNIGPAFSPLTKSDWFKARRSRKFKKFKYMPNNIESFGWYKGKLVCVNIDEKAYNTFINVSPSFRITKL